MAITPIANHLEGYRGRTLRTRVRQPYVIQEMVTAKVIFT